MPFWRCPHCATPQPESARCWLCGRSTTSCSACRHYRRGVAGGLGLCGRSSRRLALRGTEVRPCWEPASVELPADAPAARVPVAAGSGAELAGTGSRLRGGGDGIRQPRTFVPVEDLRRAPSAGPEPGLPGGVAAATSRAEPESGRWSLWGDPDA